MDKKAKGAFGESLAAEYLADRGYKIIERNWRCRYGEIDIIAEKNGVIAFVEVKTRRENAMVQPFEAVGFSKQKKIILSAECYLQNCEKELQPRFDVAGITESKGTFKIDYLENAFDSGAAV